MPIVTMRQIIECGDWERYLEWAREQWYPVVSKHLEKITDEEWQSVFGEPAKTKTSSFSMGKVMANSSDEQHQNIMRFLEEITKQENIETIEPNWLAPIFEQILAHSKTGDEINNLVLQMMEKHSDKTAKT